MMVAQVVLAIVYLVLLMWHLFAAFAGVKRDAAVAAVLALCVALALAILVLVHA